MHVNRTQRYPLLTIFIGVSLLIAALYFSARDENIQKRLMISWGEGMVHLPFPEVRRVSLGDAKAAFDLGQAMFLDVRSVPYYRRGHVPGAVNIPLAELPSRWEELSGSEWIITYCASPYEEMSARAARLLLDAGFTYVTPLSGGWEAWREAGYPSEDEGGSP